MFRISLVKDNFSARLALAGLFTAALPFLASQPAAAQSYSCNGVAIAPDPGSSTLLSFDGSVSCIYLYDATVSLDGSVSAAVWRP